MRNIRKILLITVALFVALLTFVLYKVLWDPENTKQVYYPMSKQEKGLLHSGDIILRRGYGTFSDAIIKFQDGYLPVSHCAMIIADSGKYQVAHSLSSSVAEIDGAQYQPLQRFLNESKPNSIVVVRFKSSSDTIRSIVDQVKNYANRHIPFDHDFSNSDTTRYYCTEMFQHAFYNVLGYDIFAEGLSQNSMGLYDLTTFQDTSLFRRIINHQKNN
ncbi:MAG: YiiX/YebB-like N1pC/P60 family cysteine hydrolase [Bacteroidia bacterium]